MEIFVTLCIQTSHRCGLTPRNVPQSRYALHLRAKPCETPAMAVCPTNLCTWLPSRARERDTFDRYFARKCQAFLAPLKCLSAVSRLTAAMKYASPTRHTAPTLLHHIVLTLFDTLLLDDSQKESVAIHSAFLRSSFSFSFLRPSLIIVFLSVLFGQCDLFLRYELVLSVFIIAICLRFGSCMRARARQRHAAECTKTFTINS